MSNVSFHENRLQMKDSGIPWVGMIPIDWKVFPAGGVFSEVKEKNHNNQYTNPFSFRYGEIVDKKIGDIDENLEETLSAYRIVSPNTIILNGLNLNYDFITQRVAIVKENGIITSAYLAVKPDETRVAPRFMLYLLKSYDFHQVLHSIGSGIRKTLKYQDFRNLKILAPDLETQQRIADYLDEECSKIDEIIAEAKSSIEDYKAWRTSSIYEAVTKGLKLDAEMKDSGIKSIGLIPKVWKLTRLKFLLDAIVDCPHETPVYSDDGDYYVIRTADQDVGFLRSDENMYRLNRTEYMKRTRRLTVDKDDIVYGREGERWGLAAIVPQSDKYCLGQRMMQFRCKRDIFLPEYALWALNSYSTYLQGAVDTIGSTSPHVNISTMRNYYIPLPNIDEQRIIASYITKFCDETEKLITTKQHLIEDLESYKKALIYEVVTGKRKVV